MPPLANRPSLLLALPEAILAMGILVVLFAGMVSRGRGRGRVVSSVLGLGAVAAALVATLVTADETSRGLFQGLIARDPFADYIKVLALGATFAVGLLATRARDTIDHRTDDRESPELHALLLAAALGVALMGAATDLLMVYLSLEFVSVMSYSLAGFTRGARRSAEAALKYVVYGGVASGAFLYGLSLLYGLARSTDLVVVRAALADAPTPLALVALALCLAGFGYKVAVVPFHMWCPDVYEGAPTPVAAFLSVAPKAGGFALLLRFFGQPVVEGTWAGAAVPWPLLALIIAIVTMTLGNLAALGQRNIKRLLAYSSIAHAGTLFLGLAVGTPDGHRAVLFYLGVYLFMNLAAFGAVVAVGEATEGEPVLDTWAGLGTRLPLVAFVMTMALFALAGLPPTGGFIAKYYLFSAVVAQGRATGASMYHVAAILAVLNSVVSLYVYARVIRAMYLTPAAANVARVRLAPVHAVALVALVVPTVLLGIYWAPLDALATEALRMWVPVVSVAGR